MDQCIFCKIADGQIPSKIVYEDDQAIAFLDLSQTTLGHTLVIPKSHFDSMLECDDDTLAHVWKVAREIAKGYETKLGAKGFNFVSNCHEVAGQTVHHFHIHIIPRYDNNDTFDLKYTDNSSNVDLEAIYNKVK